MAHLITTPHVERPRRAIGQIFKLNHQQKGDALDLLTSLPDACSPLAFFDPQFRGVLDYLEYGDESAKQKCRARLPVMTEEYTDACLHKIEQKLKPSGYCMLWADTFNVCEGYHLRVSDTQVRGSDLLGQRADRQRLSWSSSRRLCAGAAKEAAASQGNLA
jgi:site-specific DNA-methyltransferase (adenine-specific)